MRRRGRKREDETETGMISVRDRTRVGPGKQEGGKIKQEKAGLYHSVSV